MSASTTSRRIMVAMSGGVDSSVAAALLRDAGHDIVGVTLKLWGGESDSGCCSVSDVDDARRVADHLGIDHHTFNFGDDFNTHVVAPYIAAHAAGLTPNPCIECNRHLKFDRLLHRALALGFDGIATGHHARVVTDDDGTPRIARGVDDAKDQSYVLAMLGRFELERLELPVGEMTKDHVRELAGELGLRTADKPDSQDVCFITSTAGRRGFLSSRLDFTPGNIVDGEGEVVGNVDAVELVTIGQRRGLKLSGGGEPRYVIDANPTTQTVTVGRRSDLDVAKTSVHTVTWSAEPEWGATLVQARAHGDAAPATVVTAPASNSADAVITWDVPHQRIAPGQSLVFYRGDRVLGSGTAV